MLHFATSGPMVIKGCILQRIKEENMKAQERYLDNLERVRLEVQDLQKAVSRMADRAGVADYGDVGDAAELLASLTRMNDRLIGRGEPVEG
jgi:hypothetical protein